MAVRRTRRVARKLVDPDIPLPLDDDAQEHKTKLEGHKARKKANRLPSPKFLLGAKNYEENAEALKKLQAILTHYGFDDDALHQSIGAEFDRTGKALSREVSQASTDGTIRARLASVERRSPLDHYVLYVLQNSKLIRDLERIKQSAEDAAAGNGEAVALHKNHQAYTNAIRAQSDLYDKVLKAGFDFGVIPKKPGKGETNRPLLQLTNVQVAIALKDELGLLQALVSEATKGARQDRKHQRRIEQDDETRKALKPRKSILENTMLDQAEHSHDTDFDPPQAAHVLDIPQDEELPGTDAYRARMREQDGFTPKDRQEAMRRLFIEGEITHDDLDGDRVSFPSLSALAHRFHYSVSTVNKLAYDEAWTDKRDAFLLQSVTATRADQTAQDPRSGESPTGAPDKHQSPYSTTDGSRIALESTPLDQGPEVEPEPTDVPFGDRRTVDDDALLLDAMRPTGKLSPRLSARGVRELSKLTGLKVMTTRRRIASLVDDGYVERVAVGKYGVTVKGLSVLVDADDVASLPGPSVSGI